MEQDIAGLTSLTGRELHAMLAYSARWLHRNVAAINDINVFPVPDGDTGFNMSATLDTAVAAAAGAPDHAGRVMRAAAEGALLGARGNSGVILSQIFAGLAGAVESAACLDGPLLAAGLNQACRVARRAVAEPKPGTILTVLSDTADAVADASAGDAVLGKLLSRAASAARVSVERTPKLLPILAAAGVVDSGGLGLSVILEGWLLFGQRRELPAEVEVSATRERRPDLGRAEARESGRHFGYCTEFMVEGQTLDLASLTTEMQRIGDSVLVVGGGTLLRVHVHTEDPGAALSLGLRRGSLSRVKVENIDAQHAELTTAAAVAQTVGVVAVAPGNGFSRLFAEYGANVLGESGTANLSTAEVLKGIGLADCQTVIILPNDKDVVSTAEQAARLSPREAYVVPTTSAVQGVAALLAFNPERTPGENKLTMQQAADAVRTIEITRAARNLTIEGIRAVEGQPIALLDGRMTAAARTDREVATAALERIGGGEVATIFYGLDADADSAEALARDLRRSWPEIEIGVAYGGQPLYPYLISVE